MLMLDSKNMKRGTCTEVDLLGFEKRQTLKDRIDERDQRFESVQDVIDKVTACQGETNILNESPEKVKNDLCSN